MSEKSVKLIHVSKAFKDEAEELRILKDVNLEINPGETVAITGESGCGKSTLLSIIGGLDRATSGEIICGPYRVSALDEEGLTEYRISHLGFVFQFHYLLKDFSAMENVMMSAYMKGMKRKAAEEKAMVLLKDVGVQARAKHYPNQLSGGERQRVAVARALMNDPELVLADEPTGNLDEGNARMIFELLFEMVSKYGKTLVLVTHDRELAQNCGARYLMKDGELVRL
jgi:lipoprotein-releasing system ATP-binding protein